MSKFEVIKTPIEGLFIIEPTDECNLSIETDFQQELLEIGIRAEFVQEKSFKIPRGVLRGLHFQREQIQGILVRVTSGAILDVAIDLRHNSQTHGASWSVEISAENRRMLWIPEQFAHGFLTLEGNTEVVLNSTDYDDPKDVGGIIWNDPILCIDWQFERYDIDEKYLNISDRDKRFQTFRLWDEKTLWKK